MYGIVYVYYKAPLTGLAMQSEAQNGKRKGIVYTGPKPSAKHEAYRTVYPELLQGFSTWWWNVKWTYTSDVWLNLYTPATNRFTLISLFLAEVAWVVLCLSSTRKIRDQSP